MGQKTLTQVSHFMDFSATKSNLRLLSLPACSYVKSEVAARDEGKYCLSMELVSRQTSTILSLKVSFPYPIPHDSMIYTP